MIRRLRSKVKCRLVLKWERVKIVVGGYDIMGMLVVKVNIL